MIGMLVLMFEAMREGEFDVVDPTLERVLGRRPTDMKVLLAPFVSNDTSGQGALRKLFGPAAHALPHCPLVPRQDRCLGISKSGELLGPTRIIFIVNNLHFGRPCAFRFQRQNACTIRTARLLLSRWASFAQKAFRVRTGKSQRV
jgi:hypothetical protein